MGYIAAAAVDTIYSHSPPRMRRQCRRGILIISLSVSRQPPLPQIFLCKQEWGWYGGDTFFLPRRPDRLCFVVCRRRIFSFSPTCLNDDTRFFFCDQVLRAARHFRPFTGKKKFTSDCCGLCRRHRVFVKAELKTLGRNSTEFL